MRSIIVVVLSSWVAFVCEVSVWADEKTVLLHQRIEIPAAFTTTSGNHAFGGDIRIGDLSGDGSCDFLVYRSSQGGDIRSHAGGIKPCYIAAFDIVLNLTANASEKPIVWNLRLGEVPGEVKSLPPESDRTTDDDKLSRVVG